MIITALFHLLAFEAPLELVSLDLFLSWIFIGYFRRRFEIIPALIAQFVQSDLIVKMFRQVLLLENRLPWTLRDAGIAINALVG